MLRVVMYGPDTEENSRVRELLEDLIWSMQLKPVFHEFTGEREPFLTFVQRNPYLVMLIGSLFSVCSPSPVKKPFPR